MENRMNGHFVKLLANKGMNMNTGCIPIFLYQRSRDFSVILGNLKKQIRKVFDIRFAKFFIKEYHFCS